ncbi:enoyl-CoA hydratase/isomerase [Hyphomonas adhaerens MHS-3]|uniref:Enoyl-CoA hydratase/isomerase n=1 Tax=Hyphomonas adhaerens MHS-3 TaxID=1280949 RepID=A0A069E9N6_9PROT|nr:enoyl-CoA hydratase/isomerase family protein [Hyphomonas adhaerens]KCZ86196.1 enoyl-CoA hydratase/isomerase [Hyphomonas adhaerens MHS-3]
MKVVICEIEGGVARITLNRPEFLNAINSVLLQELADTMDRVCALPDVKIIMLTGAGRAFCVGDDLKEMNSDLGIQGPSGFLVERLQDISRAMMFSDKIVVTLVHGWAIGGGLSWVLNSDLVLFEEDAKCFFPEIGLGLYMSGAATVLLPSLAGHARAMSLFAKGEHVDAAEALRMGMASQLVPTGEGKEAIEVLCQELLSLPDELLGTVKKARSCHSGAAIEETLRRESEALTKSIASVREKQQQQQ